MTEQINAFDQTKPEPLDLNEIRVWADYAKRENKEMGMAPDCAIALLDRLQQAERDRDHYYLAAEIEAREVDRQKAAAKAAAGKLSDALSRCLKAMHHVAPFFQRGVEATLLTDAITAAQEAIVEGIELGCVQEPAQALSNEEIDLIANTMPGGLDGFLKGWGWRNFARAVEGEVLSRQEGRGGAPVAWIQAEPSARGADLRTVMQGVAYSTQWHWQSERPKTSNPVWPVFGAAPTRQIDAPMADSNGAKA